MIVSVDLIDWDDQTVLEFSIETTSTPNAFLGEVAVHGSQGCKLERRLVLELNQTSESPCFR